MKQVAVLWSCVDLARQHVFIWHEQAGEKHTGEGPCLPFGQSANTLQPSCGTITKRIFILGLWLVHSLCFVYTKLCSNAPFYWMISNNHVNSSHLEIVSFVLVCDRWGSARVYGKQTFGENGPFRSHFSVSNRPACRSFTEFKAFMGWIQQKEARIRCKIDWTMTWCKNFNFTQIDPTTVFKLMLRTARRDLSIISWEQVTYCLSLTGRSLIEHTCLARDAIAHNKSVGVFFVFFCCLLNGFVYIQPVSVLQRE